MAYKHIGVAISGNEEDALLVNKALELARHNDAHLTLIHIDDGLSELYPGIYFPATEDILQLLKNKSDNKLYKLTKNIQWPKTKLRIERGEMPETLLEIMQKSSARKMQRLKELQTISLFKKEMQQNWISLMRHLMQ